MFNTIKENFSRAFFALLFSIITIATLSFLSFNTSYGLFLAGSFGATMVLIFGYPESPFAQPKNVFFGHLITSLVAILVLQFFQINLVFAQPWPNKSIRIIVPQGAAGSTDQVARPLAKLLSDELGQPVYLENRPGSGSVNGTDVAAKSAPNGYTFLAVAVSFSISPSIYKKLP